MSLNNTEKSWTEEFLFESKPMPVTDSAGREVFWDDLGRPEYCNGFYFKDISDTEFVQDVIDFEQ